MIPLGLFQQQHTDEAGGGVPAGLLAKLVSWWDAEETGAAVRADSHGTNDLTVADGVTDTPGLIGNAMYFDGNSQAQTPAGSITGTGSFAVCAFVHPTVRDAADIMFWRCLNTASGATVPGDWDFSIGSDNQPFLRMSATGYYNSSSGTILTYPVSVLANNTYWLYAHYDSTNDEMLIAMNDYVAVVTTLSNAFTSNGNCLRMGRLTSSYPHGVQGWMDCIGYFNAPLSLEERTWLFNGMAGRTYADISA